VFEIGWTLCLRFVYHCKVNGQCILQDICVHSIRKGNILTMKLDTHTISEHYKESGCMYDLDLAIGRRIGGGSNIHLIHVGLLRRPKFFSLSLDLANLLIVIACFISYMKLV
jgi:hypothetical protein